MNAFNTIHRRAIVEELRDTVGVLGGLFPFERTFYGASTPLFFSTSQLGVDLEDGGGGRVGGDPGRVGSGLVGDVWGRVRETDFWDCA